MYSVVKPFWVAAVLGLFAFVGTASAETTLEKIKRTGKTTVGTEAAFPPFEFIKDGKIVGYGKDILDYIIADLGVELNQLDCRGREFCQVYWLGNLILLRPV
ncbi:MAG: hypothetical protein CM1200mP18_08320 [Gammaproteobacteria bacterium]|nr:MAG: hypothetical protein CM1200mP18_08320 [Gammaproteobacteria bacterium]